MSGSPQLATQTAYFDQLFEQAPEGIVLLDADDRVVRINAEFTRLFGYAPDEATGHLLNDLVRPEALDAPASPTTIRIRPSQGRVSFDAVYRARHGNLIHGGAPITDPDATRWSQATHYVLEGYGRFVCPMFGTVKDLDALRIPA